MSRFGNLEFGSEPEPSFQEQAPLREGAYYLEQARLAFEEADFERALRAYSKVLEYEPGTAAAWTGQVRSLIELGEFGEARLWADKALETFPNEAELLAAKGVALGRLGDLQGAMAFSDAAVAERGDTPYIWLARADVLLARAERRADFCFDKALAMAPRNWLVHWLAARVRYSYRQIALALRLARQALEWNPGQSGVWLLAGLCERDLGLVRQARLSLEQALQLNPRCTAAAEALRSLAHVGWAARIEGWFRHHLKA